MHIFVVFLNIILFFLSFFFRPSITGSGGHIAAFVRNKLMMMMMIGLIIFQAEY